MKYRIVEKDNLFIIQEYKYNDWFDIPTKYGRYYSLYEAKEFLNKFISSTYGKVVYEVEV